MIAQIYEIQTPQEAQTCIELGVDHIGTVILSKKDWRKQMLKDVMQSSEGTSSKNCLIPLFDDTDTILRALDYYRPHYMHFCQSIAAGKDLETDIEHQIKLQVNLKSRFPEVGIMRSIPIPQMPVPSAFPSLMIARMLEPVSDIFLTDTLMFQEPVKGFIGITGKTCDWKIARELVLQSEIPVILAGGLSPANVYDGLMEVRPAGADSCTQTNATNRGGKIIRFKKDFRKVKRFVKKIRMAQSVLLQKDKE